MVAGLIREGRDGNDQAGTTGLLCVGYNQRMVWDVPGVHQKRVAQEWGWVFLVSLELITASLVNGTASDEAMPGNPEKCRTEARQIR
jgi:hypothetical protein